jgi:hypothetical protein
MDAGSCGTAAPEPTSLLEAPTSLFEAPTSLLEVPALTFTVGI